MTREEFFATVTPAFLTFLSVAVPALLTWLTALIRGWVKKQNEAKDREALHMALATGVKAAGEKLGPNASNAAVIEYAVGYAEKSVPDAMKNLKPSAEVLGQIALAKRADAKE
jgi:hypothetical protein